MAGSATKKAFEPYFKPPKIEYVRVVSAIKDLPNKQAGIAVETANKNVVQNEHL